MVELRIINNLDTSFTLEPESQKILFGLLEDDSFLGQVAGQIEAQKVKFTGILFQPIPQVAGAPRNLAPDVEPYFTSPDYAIVNVPPSFLFKAHISNPNKLCAVFHRVK